jgi:hypothetical protein
MDAETLDFRTEAGVMQVDAPISRNALCRSIPLC